MLLNWELHIPCEIVRHTKIYTQSGNNELCFPALILFFLILENK